MKTSHGGVFLLLKLQMEGDYPKRGTWTVCRFTMGHGKKEASGVFEGGGDLIPNAHYG